MTDAQALASAIVALSGAIATLWVQVTRATRRLEKKLDDCEQDRASLWREVRLNKSTAIQR